MFDPTPEQQAIISAAESSDSSLMISALAGCAKTSTITMLAPKLKTKSVLALAFNKKIATELERVLPSNFVVKTMNSLGHSAFASAIARRLTLESNKISKLVTAASKASGGFSDDEWTTTRNLVSKARSLGLIPSRYPQARKALLSDDSWGWDICADALAIDLTESSMVLARSILEQSIDLALAGTIDFDDQIYMSTMFMGLYPKFHTVIIDEAQDLSPLNHIQLRKVVQNRLIVVGDPKQAIYAFRGADSSSMEKIREIRKDWIDLPLNLTFRCPKNIVDRQLSHAPNFRAAPSAPLGIILDYRQEEHWTISTSHNPNAAAPMPSCQPQAILCRNNAPLISMAFKLLRKRIGINMLGRDFGKSLTSLLKKICGEDNGLPADVCISRIREWSEKEVRLARANDKEEKIDSITDRGESLVAVIESGDIENLGDLKRGLAELFDKTEGQVTLSSGHKAKGLEWHTVLHLDPFRVPSKWARLARDDGNEIPWQQEMNLKYVIETRAKHTLVLANLEQFE